MSTEHEKLATLASKLEFANALCKQHDRDRAKAEVELGKMTAYAQELEHKLQSLTGLSKKQLDVIRKRIQYDDLLVGNEGLTKRLKELKKRRSALISELVRPDEAPQSTFEP